MSLGLVAYGASSDEDSDIENSEDSFQVQTFASNPEQIQSTSQKPGTAEQPMRKNLLLPKPTNNITNDDETDAALLTLNLPKPSRAENALIEEEDDEFLHKKVAPSLIQKPTTNAKSTNRRQPVKITIPSLSDYDDASDMKPDKIVTVLAEPKKPSGLLGMLPAPKGSSVLGKLQENGNAKASTAIETTKTTSLIPHSVSNRLKQAPRTLQQTKKLSTMASKPSLLGTNYDQSDDSNDSDAEDFFSLNRDEKLPEVSASEINAMVANKTAKMAQIARSFQQHEQDVCVSSDLPSSAMPTQTGYTDAQPSSSSKLVGREVADIEALCGARAAKRARKGDIQFIEISQDQVTMGRGEWERNQLQAETEYQPRGLLNDPGAGTKKKHQITYLAYQAKANEQELQAMWAANRHARRQTQSKYGF